MTVTEDTSNDSSNQTETHDQAVVENAASADDANPEESKEKAMNQEDHEELVLRARGLPWSATADDVEKFFTGCAIKGGTEGIHFTFSRDGRPSGECFVEFSTVEDYQKALQKNNEHMGKRYVEVFESKHSEMDWVCKRMGATSREKDTETVVRLRGLPYGCSKEEVANFFKGLEIAPNGITIALDEDGKNTGDAYVEFASPDIASQAMNKHKEKIGHRYIEIFHSSLQEARSALLPKPKPLMSARPGPYDRRGGFGGSGRFGGQPSGFERRYRGGGRGGFGGNDFSGGNMRGGRGGRGGFGGGYGGGGYGGGGGGGFGRDSGGLAKSTTGFCVHMRGLPFSATESDVKQWFMPLNPVAIRMEFEISGSGTRRSRGEADVDFATDSDAKAAMGKDRQMMGHRYIELFLRSEAEGDDDWSGGDQSFFSGNGMNFSSGGGFGNNFGNSGGGGAGGNFGGGGGNFGGGNFGGGSGGGNSNFGGAGGGGGGSGGGGSNYGGGYGGTSGQGGNFGNQGGGNLGGGNMGATSTFFGVQVPVQGTNNTPNSLMGNMGGTGGNYGNQSSTGGGAMGTGTNQSGYQQSTGFNQANQTPGNFSSTSAGAFNSASSFYGQDAKTGMVSYPTSY